MRILGSESTSDFVLACHRLASDPETAGRYEFMLPFLPIQRTSVEFDITTPAQLDFTANWLDMENGMEYSTIEQSALEDQDPPIRSIGLIGWRAMDSPKNHARSTFNAAGPLFLSIYRATNFDYERARSLSLGDLASQRFSREPSIS